LISVSTALRRSSNSPAELGAGDHRGQVEGNQPAALEGVRYIACDQPLRQAFDNCGLANAGLADEHGVVLGTPGQHLDYAPDLTVSPDNGIQLAVPGHRGEIEAILIKG
jgi:hypothetical protein